MTMLLPGDIGFARSHGFLGKAIRALTRKWTGEKPSIPSHTLIVVEPGEELDAVGVEALTHCKKHKLSEEYANCDTELCFFRPLNLSQEEIALICRKAESYVGRDYGYLKLLLHAADYLLDKRYVFRRLGRMDNYPICSYVVTHAYGADGKHFGVSDDAASPDDIWDYIVAHINRKYGFVWQRGTMYEFRNVGEELPQLRG